jgi:hypothetical protein
MIDQVRDEALASAPPAPYLDRVAIRTRYLRH